MKIKRTEKADRIIREERKERQHQVFQANKWHTIARHNPEVLWYTYNKVMSDLQ